MIPSRWRIKDRMTIGQRVNRLREARRLSMEGLARMAGTTKITVFRIEHGLFTPRLGTLALLALALKVPLADLLPVGHPMKKMVRRGRHEKK